MHIFEICNHFVNFCFLFFSYVVFLKNLNVLLKLFFFDNLWKKKIIIFQTYVIMKKVFGCECDIYKEMIFLFLYLQFVDSMKDVVSKLLEWFAFSFLYIFLFFNFWKTFGVLVKIVDIFENHHRFLTFLGEFVEDEWCFCDVTDL